MSAINKIIGKVFQPFKQTAVRALAKARKLFHRFLSLKTPYKIGVIVLLAAVTFTGCASWYLSHLSRPEDLFEEDLKPEPGEESDWNDWDVDAYFSQNIVNVILLGFDRDEGRKNDYSVFRTDTIKVVSINFDQEKISIINIPRDIYTRIGNTSTRDKINHSYYYGYRYGDGSDHHADGLAYTLGSVSNILGGVPFKYYVAVDMDGVIELVDAVGGVPFEVPFDVYSKNGQLLVRQGRQVLDGEKYLHYLRTRMVGGDIGRVDRQTDLLMATLEHVKSKGLFKQLPVLYSHYQQLLDTNLSNKQVISLALYLRNFSRDKIDVYTLTGFNQSSDGVYYMVMDQEKRAEIIKAVFGLEFPVKEQEILRDTVPKEPKNFSYSIITNETGDIGAGLTWLPGDKYNLLYRLYRIMGEEETLLAETKDTVYVDQEVQTGGIYHYRLEAVNRRETSPSVTLQVYIDPALVPPPGGG
ncbi:MAG TPA: LCP family protein, partial [Firmicutes bacterium]|nr:LCP family protein [Bacillota bacterium]